MTQNIGVTPGVGATVAADSVGGVLFQEVKINLGATNTDGGLVTTANPFPVAEPGSIPLNITPTITAGAYTTGMVVGGILALTNAARVNAGSGLIQTVSVIAATALTAPYDVFFFNTSPGNGTYTDHVALALSTDVPCGVVHCNDLVSGGTPQILQALAQAVPFQCGVASATLYAVVVIRGGQTFATTTAISLNLMAKRD